MKVAFVTDMHFGYKRFEQDAPQGRKPSGSRATDLLILRRQPTRHFQGWKRLPKLTKSFARRKSSAPAFPASPYCNTRQPRPQGKGFVHLTDLLPRRLACFHNKPCFTNAMEKVAISGMGTPEDMAGESSSRLPANRPRRIQQPWCTSHSRIDRMKKQHITFDELPPGYDLYLCGHVHQKILKQKC